MNQKTIQERISTIVSEWSHLLKESGDEPEYYDFILIKAASLKLNIHELLAILANQFETDKKAKMSFQMLAKSLERMESLMDFKVKLGGNADGEHIKMVLTKIKSIESEIEVLRKHITN